jgi:hypothetical protein
MAVGFGCTPLRIDVPGDVAGADANGRAIGCLAGLHSNIRASDERSQFGTGNQATRVGLPIVLTTGYE